MPAAPLPSFEHGRLQALMSLKILDTTRSQHLDSIVQAAAKMLQSPMAAISLVAESRQWFKSSIGFENMTETPRNVSFCAYTVLDPANALIVENALEDQRFIDNPLVIGNPHIRSYAGAPVLCRSGFPIGALCFIDSKPRSFTCSEIDFVTDVSRIVAKSVRLHGALQNLKRH